MGLMFTSAFALGIVIISKIASSTHLMHILFGNVLGVQPSALLLTLVASMIALLVVWLAYRPLLLYAFDPLQAQALGFNTSIIHYGLILLLTPYHRGEFGNGGYHFSGGDADNPRCNGTSTHGSL
ncbi:hypothetical protein HSBAA_27720 [Vreelandella sulfidaeris]|uniref:Uncharacterized protein n=1 Tax=Vreelandella sulfidaeris TaxID=115553 RepID=A0A455U5R7_9GAMM|nr:hypothetical protein HSBAA_27720 [Halomonas sulfidaeris]